MTPTREEVIRVARDCGLTSGQHWNKQNMTTAFMLDFASHFYEAGAAAAREQFYGQDKPESCRNGCPAKQICDYCQIAKPVQEMIAKAVAEAREPLVEALKGLLDDTQHVSHFDCDEGPCPVRDAREALAKATGEKT